jgi:hypothetical protein
MYDDNNKPCATGCRVQIADDGNPSCITSDTPDCDLATLVEANESSFHDSQLIQATQAINDILTQIPADAEGRNLSFLRTKWGFLLAWVDHGAEPIADAVTSDSDDETFAAALGINI